ADRFVDFGEKHGMCVVGHTLVWHSQAPGWLFKDDKGGEVSAAELNARMESHIEVLAGRYKGKIHTWDVVNEAIDEDKGWRKSPWFTILGPEYMERAFRLAHQADPASHLIYNDYNMHSPGKREFLFKVLRDYLERGVPIHGVGMQGHVGLDYPDMTEFENTMKACADLGLALHVTELEVDVLPAAWEHMGAEISTNFAYSDELNPYVDGLPDKVQQQLTDRYVQLFELFLKYEKHIARITTWGTNDAENWKNDFPVRGRTNYPTLFDRQNRPKPAYHAVKALKG
ncbi:MAG TPA: endo-1,4-beta-xylanase, partial [Marinobacter sp.]|nr:endo-1,4-beta-xylanase [Marinobacter sp.]